MPTKRAQRKAAARDEEPQYLRGVVNPASGIRPRRPVVRPAQADPVSGSPVIQVVTPSQNPRGGY
jgi:hypothetical protein